MDNVGTTDTLYLAHRVKQLKILEHSMFLVSLEKKWEDLVYAEAKMGQTCHSPYYSPNTEVTLHIDIAPLAPAD